MSRWLSTCGEGNGTGEVVNSVVRGEDVAGRVRFVVAVDGTPNRSAGEATHDAPGEQLAELVFVARRGRPGGDATGPTSLDDRCARHRCGEHGQRRV
jgi:hypothetical protein